MPKWCKCILTISFSKKNVYNKWKTTFKLDTFNMNEYFVNPKKVKGVLLKNKSWGTMWEVCKDSFEYNDQKLFFIFTYNSVWTPNIPVLESVYKKIKESDRLAQVRCTFNESFSNHRGLFLNGELDIIKSDSFYKLVIMQESNLDFKDEYSIKRTKNKDLFLYKKTYLASYPIDKKLSKNKVSSNLDGNEKYIEHACYVIDLEDTIPVIEYKNKFYF